MTHDSDNPDICHTIHNEIERVIRELNEKWEDLDICDTYPPALQKACWDEFEYAALIDGFGVVTFESAETIDEQWVRLHGVLREVNTSCGPTGAMNFERGLEVRVDHLIWVADAPHGS